MRIVDSFGGTHQGRVRPINEDRFLLRPDEGVMLVADGMGGHSHGDIASSAIVSHVDAALLNGGARGGLGAVADAIRAANGAIIDIARANDGLTIGSTVAALVLEDARFRVAWTGDSRVYLLRDGAVRPLTRDHTEADMLLRDGRITPEEAAGWPRAHVIAHAIGVVSEPHLETAEGEARAGDAFVACTDGLTAHVADEEIAILAAGATAERLCKELVRLALERGGTDNVSVVVGRVGVDL